ncbi:hypothetical protein JMJ55_20980 [Belnapia sp. T6]|uniref:Tetratricopeptide repeat-containing protein n=1 Tax=Belnapia mucosa TaxID=2804532 RepID=A0ABS1V828_9PROT|nr:hypothetical protein [Belnapia mucosa]MBL6457817.1 hypothetical protein [Belnapia mucosa]
MARVSGMAADLWAQFGGCAPQDWDARLALLDRLLESESGQGLRDALFHAAETWRRLGDWTRSRAMLDRLAAGLEAAPAPPFDFLRYLMFPAETAGRIALAEQALRLAEARPEAALPPAFHGELGIARQRLDRALAIRAEVSGLAVPCIPVGMECLPYNLLMRWGFAELAVEGPYTAAIAPERGVSQAIADRFARFGDPTAYGSIRSPSGGDTPHLPAYGMLLGHETGPAYAGDGFARLAALYAARAERLLAAAAGLRALFVMERYPPTDLARIEARLAEAFPQLDFRIAVIGYTEAPAPDSARLRVLKVRKPGADYVWHTPEAYNTAPGLAYERPMAEMVRAAVLELAQAT